MADSPQRLDMFDWIPELLNRLTAFIPRFHKIPPTYRMVKWSRCRAGTIHGPGLVWFWPLVTEVEEVDVRWQSTVTHTQSLTLKDGTPVSARFLAVWRVSEPLVAVGENTDYSDRAAEVSQSCVVDVLGVSQNEMIQDVSILNMLMTVAVREALGEIGIEVKFCKFTELVIAPAVRLISGD